MRRERTKQTLKLHLLAFVLALALVWYSLNPAPSPITRTKREDEAPEEKKRRAELGLRGAALSSLMLETTAAGFAGPAPPAADDEDNFDWPEFIDG